MSNRKKIQKIVGKYAQNSVTNNKINQRQVLFYSSEFKKLPGNQAIIYLTEYIRALKRLQAQFTLYIESSEPVTSAQKQRIIKSLKKGHAITSIVTKINSSILGGIRVKIGDHIYEDTLQNRINQIGEFIQTNG